MRVHVLRRVLSRFERHSRGSPNGTQPSVATMATFENVRPKFVVFFSYHVWPRLCLGHFTTTSRLKREYLRNETSYTQK